MVCLLLFKARAHTGYQQPQQSMAKLSLELLLQRIFVVECQVNQHCMLKECCLRRAGIGAAPGGQFFDVPETTPLRGAMVVNDIEKGSTYGGPSQTGKRGSKVPAAQTFMGNQVD